MRALVLYCHPKEHSFNAAVRDLVLEKLKSAGVEYRLCDLYAEEFPACLSAEELERYEDTDFNQVAVANQVEDLRWCDTLVFVYPTWWYGLPARLKGWLDRVLVPGVAFDMPCEKNETICPTLTHITGMAVFTTGGASRWLTFFVGAPGKKTLMRGVRILCAKRCRTAFAMHYLMDSSTPQTRKAHLEKVARKMDRFIAKQPSTGQATTNPAPV